MRELTYSEAIREALRLEMLRDDRVFIIGEDVGVYGGAFGVTLGLVEEFGEERVIDTPISELGIAGAITGAALTGMRPVGEIMFMDFITLASEQVVNQAAKIRFMFGGKAAVPFVLRTPAGSGTGAAAQHSQSLENWFVHIPGLKVVMPSTPYDVKGLLIASIHDDNPVIFIEHKLLYRTKGRVPEEPYTIPLSTAEVKREGHGLIKQPLGQKGQEKSRTRKHDGSRFSGCSGDLQNDTGQNSTNGIRENNPADCLPSGCSHVPACLAKCKGDGL